MSEPAKANVIFDLIVLAFRNSEVADIVGHEALRLVVKGEYRRMRQGDNLDLTPLWSILVEQPGFDMAKASPALCKLRSWEKHFGLTVVFPAALKGLDDATIAQWADSIAVPDEALREALESSVTEDSVDHATDAMEEAMSEARGNGNGRDPNRTSRMTVTSKASKHSLSERLARFTLPMAIIGFALLGYSGYQVYGYIAASEVESATVDFAGIPVKDGKKLGTRVSAVLADSAWLKKPKEERENQLRKALDASSGVNGVLLFSDKRKLRASAIVDPTSGLVRFYFAK